MRASMASEKPANNPANNHKQVAFIGEVETAEQNNWIEAINIRSKTFSLVPLASMSAASIDLSLIHI